jgi:hypothetical protein
MPVLQEQKPVTPLTYLPVGNDVRQKNSRFLCLFISLDVYNYAQSEKISVRPYKHHFKSL